LDALATKVLQKASGISRRLWKKISPAHGKRGSNMVTLDTNIWIRYLTNDDQQQAQQAIKLIGQCEAVFLPKTILLEIEWVLRAAYKLKPKAISNSLLHILGLPMVTPESPGQVAVALEHFSQGHDFADALHLAGSDNSRCFFTFDERFASKGKGAIPPVKLV
jgi:predicted nucleic-acid-binding protein